MSTPFYSLLPFGDFDSSSPIIRLWTFVVYSLLIVLVALFFLFYLSRTATKLLAWVLCLYTWRRFGIWVDLGAVSFAPLSGKLFFKALRVYSENFSITVIRGHLTFKYWRAYRPQRHRNIERSDSDPLFSDPDSHLKVHVDGVECFVFNRTSAYTLLEKILHGSLDKQADDVPRKGGSSAAAEQVRVLSEPSNKPLFRWPFEIVGTTGAIIVGNPDLPSIMTITYKDLVGTYTNEEQSTNLQPSITSLKDIVRLRLTNAKTTIRLNVDYKEPTLNYAARLRVRAESTRWTHWLSSLLFPTPELDTSIPLAGLYPWQGLQRFRDAVDSNAPSKFEYAQVAQVIECKQLDIVYSSAQTRVPPQTATSFEVMVFFAGASVLRIPTREPSKDKEFLESEASEAALRGGKAGETRPYGWIEITFNPGSSLSMSIPLLPTNGGFETRFGFDFVNAVVKTSVNFKEFILAKKISLVISLASPLTWNGLRDWRFLWTLSDCDVYLLREHITLVMDVVKDLNSQPPPGLAYFSPSIYTIDFDFQNLKIWFNINPMNVIRNHNDAHENDYVILTSQRGHLGVNISFERFEPEFRTVGISGQLLDLVLSSSFSDKNKLKTFLKSPFNRMITTPTVIIDATYTYCKVAPGARDTLSLQLEARHCVLASLQTCVREADAQTQLEHGNLNAHGHVVPTVMSLLRNYFGDASRILTPEAYQLGKLPKPASMEGRNPFELHLQLFVRGLSANLPCSLYGASDSISGRTNNLQLDLHSKVDGQDLQLHIQRFTTPPPASALLLGSWHVSIGQIVGDFEPRFATKLASAAQSFVVNMNDVHPTVRDFVNSRTDARSASSLELTIRHVELCLRLEGVLTRLVMPHGVFAHTDNCVFIKGDMARLLNIPLLVISSLQLPDLSKQTRGRHDYAAEVFRLETAVLVDNKRADDNAAEAARDQYDFIKAGDQVTGGRLHELLKLAAREQLAAPGKPPSFFLRMPLYFQSAMSEPSFEGGSDGEQPNPADLLSRAPPSMADISYADHLAIYDVEGAISAALAHGATTGLDSGHIRLVKHPDTPPLVMPTPNQGMQPEGARQRVNPGENHLRLHFQRNTSIVLTPLSLKAVIQALQSFISEQVCRSRLSRGHCWHSGKCASADNCALVLQPTDLADEFGHVLDSLDSRHRASQKPQPEFAFLNVLSIFFSTISVRLISSIPNGRRTTCIADLVLQSFSGFAKMKGGEFVPGQVELRLGSVDAAMRIKEMPQFDRFQIQGLPPSTWQPGDVWHSVSEPISAFISIKTIALTFEVGTGPRNIMSVERVVVNAVAASIDAVLMQVQLWRGFLEKLRADAQGVIQRPTNILHEALPVIAILQETGGLAAPMPPQKVAALGLARSDDDVGMLLLYLRLSWDSARVSSKFAAARSRASQISALGGLGVLCDNMLKKWGYITRNEYPLWFLRVLDPVAFAAPPKTSQPLFSNESRLVTLIGSTEFSIFDESGESNAVRISQISMQPRIKSVALFQGQGEALPLSVLELTVVASVDSVEMCIFPKFIAFVLASFKDWRRRTDLVDAPQQVLPEATANRARSPEAISLAVPDTQRMLSFSALLQVNRAVATIQERNVEARIQFQGIAASMQSGHNSLELTSPIPHGLGFLLFSSVRSAELQLSERVAISGTVHTEVIFALLITGARVNVGRSRKPADDMTAAVVVDNVTVHIPRSLIRIQMFFEKLKAEDIPRYSSALREASMSTSVSPQVSPVGTESQFFVAQQRILDVLVKKVAVETGLLTNFRFSYELEDATVSVLHQAFSPTNSCLRYMYRLRKQLVRFLSTLALADFGAQGPQRDGPPLVSPQHQGEVPLPTSFSTGSIVYSRSGGIVPWDAFYNGSIVLESIDAAMSIDIVDQLLTTYSVLAGELNEVVRVFSFHSDQRRRLRRAELSNRSAAPEPAKGAFKYAIKLTVKDISISADSPANSVVIASSLLNGFVTNNAPDSSKSRLLWSLVADGLSLSLMQRSPTGFPQTLASVFIDLSLQNWRDVATNQGVQVVEDVHDITFRKIHALMQPAAIGKIVEVVVFWQSAMRQRNLARQEELNEIRTGTRVLLESLKINTSDGAEQPTTASLLARPMQLTVNSLSVLLPIIDDFDLQRDWKKAKPTDHADAVLLHLRSAIIMRDGRDAQAQISQLSVMFISRFNPTNERDFDPESHFSQNKAVLPLVRVNMTQSSQDNISRFKVQSSIEGFSVELDATISEKIASLSKIYHKGRQTIYASFPPGAEHDARRLQFLGKTVGRLESAIIKDASGSFGGIANATVGVGDGAGSGSSRRASFGPGMGAYAGRRASLELRQAREAPPPSAIEVDALFEFASGSITVRTIPHELRSQSSHQSPLSPTSDIDPDRLLIPGLTLSVNGGTTLGEAAALDPRVPKRLHVELAIHPSDNILNPSIIEFFEDMAATIRRQRYESGDQDSAARKNAAHRQAAHAPKPLHAFINSQVADGLESAARDQWKAGYTGSVNYERIIQNLRGSLRHIFSSEDCIRGEIPSISFSANMDQTTGRGFAVLSTFSVPHISAHVNMRQLQDLFLFTHLWFKRGAGEPANKPNESPPRPGQQAGDTKHAPAATKHPMHQDSLSVALVMDKIDVVVEMGPSIGRASLSLKNLNSGMDLVWLGLLPTSRTGHLSVGAVLLAAEGRLAGSATLNTIRGFVHSTDPQDSESGTLGTSASLSVERVDAGFQYQNERILILEMLAPAAVLKDTWLESQLSLDVTVLIDSIRFVVSRHAAPRCLQLFRRITASIRDKAMTAKMQLANSSARFVDSEKQLMVTISVPPRRVFQLPHFEGVVKCAISIKCASCFGTTARNNFRDTDCAQISLSNFELSLTEIPAFLEKLDEATTISFDRIAIKKSSLKPVSQSEERMWSTTQWLTFLSASAGSDVLKFPKLAMHLDSESDLIKNRAEYSFRTDFGGRIYVALNIGHYRFLLDLVKSYEKAVSTLDADAEADGGPALPLAASIPAQLPESSASSLSSSPRPSSPSPSAASAGMGGAGSGAASAPLSPAATRGPSLGPRALSIVRVLPRPKPVLVRTGELVFEPQLKVTGDATPTELVESLGLHKEDIPRMVYTFVTVGVSDFLHQGVGRFYKACAIRASEEGFISPLEDIGSDAEGPADSIHAGPS
nr:hypothetical protein HK105_001223 [Polyrhizophydium stewartii]